MKTRTAVTATSYSVEVTVRQFLLIERRDDKLPLEQGLMHQLMALGASDVEYNGHFGSAIFYTLSAGDDTEQLRRSIEQRILDYANRKALPPSA